MKEKLWGFTDSSGSFESSFADRVKSLYFPLANERLMSSVTPDLHGDIKAGQNSFLLAPVSRIDLVDSRSSRNFWVYIGKSIDKGIAWSAAGVSKERLQLTQDRFHLEAGLLWHKVQRENRKIGLKAEILSFVPAPRRGEGPAGGEPVEVMQVTITNVSRKKIKFTPTAAIPIYARAAGNLRDHRQVTSLLQRIELHKFGIIVKPTLVFDETGHRPNKSSYFVLGCDEAGGAPQYLYPTQEIFCGESGDLEAPQCVLENLLPAKKPIQGKEAMGTLRFRQVTLSAGKSRTFIIVMGVAEDKKTISAAMNKFKNAKKVSQTLEETKKFWVNLSQQAGLDTGNLDFDNWFRWVSIQPALRKIFGCSFLPDFDYGKGGRGWRDLWQDCLGLLLSDPQSVRALLVNNFSGVRIDGSNATIIGKKPGEFLADRNDIARVWMDHGIWPLLTLDLYLNETGDFEILNAKAPYFCDRHLWRAQKCAKDWDKSYGNKLKTKSGKIYQGTILEHLLVQNLVQFFNAGEHNHVRLEGADWNDGLDMAGERGESVAFSCMYAQNLNTLADLLLKSGRRNIQIAQELKILLAKVNYANVKEKRKILARYFARTEGGICGKQASVDCLRLAEDLKNKAAWMAQHISKDEWLKAGFFNGYYDNKGRRVEGKKGSALRMTLTGQVFPIMSGVAADEQVRAILKSVKKYLWDKKLGGIHLNTDFGQEQLGLGRAFSFNYGDKENGAFFNHMVVMFAYALYKRGFIADAWQALKSIYNLATDTAKSKIYPCLPEYFNLEGRGMYSYLTGSASWFVLTLLTQAFGIKGQDGDLFIEPKLSPAQFPKKGNISASRTFAARKFKITFTNSRRLSRGKYKIVSARLNNRLLPLASSTSALIRRRDILKLSPLKTHSLEIILL